MSRPSEALAELLSRAPLPCIIAAAAEHEGTVLCVGGSVRDALLGRPAADVDIAVAGDLEAFVARFAERCGRRPVPIGDPVRDTHRTRLDGMQVDVGSMLGSVREDLARRDFTVNAMAVRLGGGSSDRPELVDPHAGLDDLDRRSIRRVSARSLREDPLRMLRALRYLAVLDGFRIESKTLREIEARSGDIAVSAAERVQAEWAELLAAPRWAEAARLAFGLGIGRPTLGFATTCGHAARWAAAEAAGDSPRGDDARVMRLAALIAGPPLVETDAARDALLQRRWPRRLAVCASRVAGWSTAVVSRDVDTVDWSLRDPLAASRAARLAATMPEAAGERAGKRLAALRRQSERAAAERWVTGRDLISWGLTEGPDLGAVLKQAARGQVERRWRDADDARAWARRRVADIGAGKSR